MIKYSLICDRDHEFEAWFSSASDYDAQAQSALVECPLCGTKKVEKAIMAPNVRTSRKKEDITSKHISAMKMMNDAANKIRKEIETQCDYVGEKFAEEARAIHYGEKEERGIYGQATLNEVAELREEGVGVAPLPDIFAPKPKQGLN